MKLDIKVFRYLTADEWRVLTAAEMGSKNHEVVPTSLIIQLASLRTGGNTVQKCISTLAKADLIARVRNTKYDGYRLTYGGYDYLALHAHTKSEAVLHLGSQMGVGKESDIYLVTAPVSATTENSSEKEGAKPVQSVLKIHRLGRTSFRSLARNRAYHRHRQHCSWQYLSRLSAQKEFAAMCALHRTGFPVPHPIAWNRHTIVMSLVPGVPLKDVPLSAFAPEEPETPASTGDHNGEAETRETNNSQRDEAIAALYAGCIDLAMQLASHGLIHGDLNEFNILIGNVPGAFETDSASDPDGNSLSTQDISSTNKSDGLSETNLRNRPAMKPYLIDFPQITSFSHPSAEEFFNRDIRGIKSFFRKRYHFESEDEGPTFADALARLRTADATRTTPRLDVEIEAAGFSKKLNKHLEQYFATELEHDEEDDSEVVQFEDQEASYQPDAFVDTEDKESLHGNSQQNPLHNSSILEEAETADLRPIEGDTATAQLPMLDKLSSLSIATAQTQGHKTKASTGWSI